MKRILVAVDFSACSRRAFQMAVTLCRSFDARLHVVHVAPEVYHHLNASAAILPVRPDASRIERALTELILDEFKGTAEEFGRIDKKILEGIEWLEIVKEAERTDTSLVVMGTHGRSMLQRAFLGSVSDGVLRKARVPVLLVPENGNPQPESLLVAIEGNAAGMEPLLQTADAWKSALGAGLSVLHVIDRSQSPALLPLPEDLKADLNLAGWESQLRQSIEWTVSRVLVPCPAVEFRHGRPHREISRQIEEGGVDLCILGAHGAGGSGLGRTALRVAHLTPCAILVVK